ncbi:MAG: hypothetical protein ABIR39_16395 [Nocardioides sp.]|uniref:hypothetical protein n=1 Tax=Nocardioides sp. TaxID=35761 RepID=UPI00326505C7
MLRSPVPTSRRTAIALALSAPLALSACEFDPPSAVPTEAPTTEPLPDADVAGVARAQIVQMVATIEATIEAHPRLRRELTPWLDLHDAHLTVLDVGDDQTATAAIPPPTGAAARQIVLGAEGALASRLADTARQAASGDLARALASMSAAVTQRVIA